jgi:hypothetical protein
MLGIKWRIEAEILLYIYGKTTGKAAKAEVIKWRYRSINYG